MKGNLSAAFSALLAALAPDLRNWFMLYYKEKNKRKKKKTIMLEVLLRYR
jgi:hypothetical protein